MRNLKELFEKLKYPVIFIIFLLIIESYIFYSISYNFLIILILLIFLIILPKISNNTIRTILIITQLIIISIIAYFSNSIYILDIFIPIIHALLYYYKSNKKHSYQIIFSIFTISLIFANFMLLITWIIASFFIKHFLIFSIYTSIIKIILFVFLYIKSTIYLAKLIKIYNFEKYFKFKRFKFLNKITSTNTNKSIIKLLIIVGIICFIVFIISQIIIFNDMKKAYTRFTTMEKDKEIFVKDIWFDENYKLFKQKLEHKGFYNISYVRKDDSRFFDYRNKIIENDINFYYRNCNLEFECEIAENTKSKILYLNEDGFNKILLAYKNDKKILLEITDDNFNFNKKIQNLLLNIPNANFFNYSQSNGAKYLNKKYKDKIFNRLNNSLPKLTYINVIKNNGLPVKKMENMILSTINFTKAQTIDVTGDQIYTNEIYWIKRNKEGINFYNNATNLKEHIIKLNESILKLEEIYNELNKTNNEVQEFECKFYFINNKSIFNKTINRFYSNNAIHLGLKECLFFKNIFKYLNDQTIKNMYYEINKFLKNNLNNQSDVNKALDMKMIEYIFAEKITGNYENCKEECQKKVLEITKNPNFCWFDYENKDKCLMKYPYDKGLCEQIENLEFKEKCLNNFN